MPTDFRSSFRALADREFGLRKLPFFKTGKGQYGEGDQFLGITVPQTRAMLPASDALAETDVIALLHSEWHEERLLALLILERRFKRAKKDLALRSHLAKLYLANTRWINNWDLVDASAPGILGEWLLTRDRSVLRELAQSKSLWEQRIAILATFAFIRAGEFADTLELSTTFLSHPHDLMHKACGWMLREVGKRDESALSAYLDQHVRAMPRTMLRYAIERLTPAQRARYLSA